MERDHWGFCSRQFVFWRQIIYNKTLLRQDIKWLLLRILNPCSRAHSWANSINIHGLRSWLTSVFFFSLPASTDHTGILYFHHPLRWNQQRMTDFIISTTWPDLLPQTLPTSLTVSLYRAQRVELQIIFHFFLETRELLEKMCVTH